jgi:nitrite reductase/ring-hydroxylating ferredoxin subunit
VTTSVKGHIRAGTLEQLKERGCTVVTGQGHTIAVFHHDGEVHAVDNRCPHMGFPLDRGSVKDGILTCHWHHARFDLSSGGTFNPFADDVRSFPVNVADGEVWIDPEPQERDEEQHWQRRLEDGLEHNIRLVIAKAVLGLQTAGADYREPLKIGAQFGTTYSANGWGAAMSILTCTANILSKLHEEDRPRALYQGLLHVGRECAGKAPRFAVEPLPTGETRPDVFVRWFRDFIDVRDEEGAERCLITAIALGLPRDVIAHMIFAAATDHIYLDAGHVVDFANKAFELLDHLGWEMAGQVLPSLVHGMARARRSQELSQWRQPIDLASMVWEAREELPGLLEQGRSRSGDWDDADALASRMLGDSPVEIIESIKEAVAGGAAAEQLGAAVAHAAFLRMAHFHLSNEFRDWDTVHNTLTAANALHQALKRAPNPELLRGVFDIAMSIYLDRFLNMPPQRLPEAAASPVPGTQQLDQLLEMVDVRQQVEESAQAVSGYLAGNGAPEGLMATMGRMMLREDAGFHSFQIVDAAFQQFESRRGAESGRHVMVGLSRFLAAHSPTPRAEGQTYQIALRLQRGEEIYE